MDTYQFKTNIKCGGCIAAVTPFLDGEAKISHWEVDLQDPDRILTASGEGLLPEDVVRAVEAAGYKAEPLD